MNHKEFLNRITEYFNRDIMPPVEDELTDPSVAGTPEVESYDAEDDVYPDEDDMEGVIETASDQVLKHIRFGKEKEIQKVINTHMKKTGFDGDVEKIHNDFDKFTRDSKKNYTKWEDAWKDFIKQLK